ncbi:unnamed protein product [Aphanomyces euteiches]|uniref:RING-type domain-containing protein n=1 Tax=Aphanomyces euteiches TaxID=100861 RepID=A0A6G0XC24_9STRA|nr:hypothetical protein Ae201684_006345 [Aphanomyces euteiches]KAH9090812.1 hypothetical protein Ae201684P_006217 [Aphanomyces euteiches]KAH9138744.1 hypothetical protein AeRB84_016940 [Aphanomyces euteiches]
MLESVLVPESPACSNYRGFVALGSKQFMLRVTYTLLNPDTNAVSLSRAGLQADAELTELLQPYLTVLTRRLQQSTSVDAFLSELEDLLQGIARGPHSLVQAPPLPYYETLLNDVAKIGWDRIVEINTDDKGQWNGLHVRLTDSSRRSHVVSFLMDATYPTTPPVCGVDVPEPMPPLQWPSTAPSLQHAIDQVQVHLEKFQDFWAVLDDIDKKCCVLEPERPTRGCKRRRLAVQPSISLQFQILDPLLPRALVDVVWFGNDAAVHPLRDRMYANLSKWKASDSIRKNLERVLQMRFPSAKTAVAAEALAQECGICYTHRLDDRIPDRVCESVNCARPFHDSCLVEWLQSIPTSRKSFGTIFGSCPYCREPISTKWTP